MAVFEFVPANIEVNAYRIALLKGIELGTAFLEEVKLQQLRKAVIGMDDEFAFREAAGEGLLRGNFVERSGDSI